MKIKIKNLNQGYLSFLDRRVKPIVIAFFVIVGVLSTVALIGYVFNETLKEFYQEEKIIINNRVNDRIVEGSNDGLDDSNESIEDLMVAEVSAYTSSEEETDSTPYITADGTDLREVYECVVASNDHEFGTKLAIENLGICTVHDRMNSRYTNAIDVYMGNDKQRALEFGRKELSYIVIE